jgi:hypothetical protein
VRQRPSLAAVRVGALLVVVILVVHLSAHAPPLKGIYGSAFAMDSKDNYQVGWTVNQKVAHRFRAGTSSNLNAIAINQRGGPGYSGGNGGVMKVTVQTDSGGKPSGTILASLTITPGNPSGDWEVHSTYTFASPARLTAGVLYHIVFSNTDASPTANYISVNEAYVYAPSSPRQPGFSDDFAVMYDRGPGWTVTPNDTPVMDLIYANGYHDGNAYSSVVADYYSIISGNQMVRERFTIPGTDRVFNSATVRVKRISGSSPLTIRLETSSGTLVATGVTGASQIPLSTVPTPSTGNHWDDASLAGGRWVSVTFPNTVVLTAGTTYNLRVSTSSDTKYAAVPLRVEDDTSPAWASPAFRDGSAQRTSDGSAWAAVYAYARLDLQFYFR